MHGTRTSTLTLPGSLLLLSFIGTMGCVGEIGAAGGGGGDAGVTGPGGGTIGTGGTVGAGGVDGGGGDLPSTTVTCTSMTTWRQGNEGSTDMNPGQACISCHEQGEGPILALAGTVYPTAHEPDNCNGADGSNGAQVIITQANGKVLTLMPGPSGNFLYIGSVALPYQAKLVYMGRERTMVLPQQSGDCNSCHTVDGAQGAPGRIMLP